MKSQVLMDSMARMLFELAENASRADKKRDWETERRRDGEQSCRLTLLRLSVSLSLRLSVPLSLHLSAFRAVKQRPDGEVIGEILKAVFASGGRKDQIAGLKSPPRRPVKECAASTRDDVNLVARVWRLRIASTRGVHLDLKTAM